MAKPEKNKSRDDGNSEKELIDLLRDVLTDEFKKVNDALDKFSAALASKETKENERHGKIMTALETLTASVNANTQGQAALTTAVNAAIVRIGTPGATDVQLLTLATAIDQSTQSDAALTAALVTAVTPPSPTPTPTPINLPFEG